jgi:hypothetical protein
LALGYGLLVIDPSGPGTPFSLPPWASTWASQKLYIWIPHMVLFYNKMIWVLCVHLVYTLRSSFHILLDRKYSESRCQWYIVAMSCYQLFNCLKGMFLLWAPFKIRGLLNNLIQGL